MVRKHSVKGDGAKVDSLSSNTVVGQFELMILSLQVYTDAAARWRVLKRERVNRRLPDSSRG